MIRHLGNMYLQEVRQKNNMADMTTVDTIHAPF